MVCGWCGGQVTGEMLEAAKKSLTFLLAGCRFFQFWVTMKQAIRWGTALQNRYAPLRWMQGTWIRLLFVFRFVFFGIEDFYLDYNAHDTGDRAFRYENLTLSFWRIFRALIPAQGEALPIGPCHSPRWSSAPSCGRVSANYGFHLDEDSALVRWLSFALKKILKLIQTSEDKIASRRLLIDWLDVVCIDWSL